jgi:hypothetical protein
MSLEGNLADLRSHADDFTAGRGCTLTVLDPTDGSVVGCVCLCPPESSASATWSSDGSPALAVLCPFGSMSRTDGGGPSLRRHTQ